MRFTLLAAMPVLLEVTCARPALASPPPMAAAGRVRYEIDATVDEAAGRINARARLVLPASALASPRSVVIDERAAGEDQGRPRLHVEAARAPDGTRLALDRTPGGGRVILKLPGPAPDVSIVEVTYSLPLDSGSVAQLGYWQYGGDEPGDLWFPDVLDGQGHRPRFRDFRVALDWPADCAVVTSGMPTAPAAQTGDRVRGVFVAEDVAGFALNVAHGYVTGEVDAGDGHQVVYLAPPQLEGQYRQAAEEAAATIRWYRTIYGFFPVKRIAVAPGVAGWLGGFPATNVFYIHRGNLTPGFVRAITAHELGHYYWGKWVLSAAPEALDWVMLGNGIWLDQLYLARHDGRPLEAQWRSPERLGWFRQFLALGLAPRDGRLDIPAAEEAALSFDYNTGVRHAKGAVGIYLLARVIGVERFLQVQRDLLRDFRHRPLSAANFAARLEAAGLAGATELVTKLARGDGSLGFAVSGADCTTAEGDWRCKAKISRTGTLPAACTVEVRDERGGVVRRVVPGTETEATVEVTLHAPLAEVRLDPDGELPITNSDSPDIQRLVVLALDDVGQTELFLATAARFLARWPDDPILPGLVARRRAALHR